VSVKQDGKILEAGHNDRHPQQRAVTGLTSLTRGSVTSSWAAGIKRKIEVVKIAGSSVKRGRVPSLKRHDST